MTGTGVVSRLLGELTYQEATRAISERSILCLPLGAIEQHGPHLPLNTDVIVAEGVTRRILDRWGERLDLWQLPTLSIGLSREHDWAAGTLSLSIPGLYSLSARPCARDCAFAAGAQSCDHQRPWRQPWNFGEPVA